MTASSARETLIRPCTDPRNDWLPRARRLQDHLAGLYRAGDILPTLAAV
ncbi:hypothetical protein [Streptomyces sp. NPDC056628]